MGDRTTVTLTVLLIQENEAKELMTFEPEDSWEDDIHTYFEFHEVNYGTLGFLPKLKDAGIAYDSHWERGSEFGPGTVSVRFDLSGDLVEKEVYDCDKDPDIDVLMEAIDEPERLRKLIVDHHEEVTPLPWDNQQLFGQRYRAKQLITT